MRFRITYQWCSASHPEKRGPLETFCCEGRDQDAALAKFYHSSQTRNRWPAYSVIREIKIDGD